MSGKCRFVDLEAELSDGDGQKGVSSDEEEGEWTKEDLEFIVDDSEDEEAHIDGLADVTNALGSSEDKFAQTGTWYTSLDNKRRFENTQFCGICNDAVEDKAVLGDNQDCSHVFCFLCICTWSLNSENCPICNAEFTEIHHSVCSKCVLVRKITDELAASQLVTGDRWPRKIYTQADWGGNSKYGIHYSLFYSGAVGDTYEDELHDDGDVDHSTIMEEAILNQACSVCKAKDNEELTLVCDNCHETYHTYCLEPGLSAVPEGDWSCPPCKHAEQRLRSLLGLDGKSTHDQMNAAKVKIGTPINPVTSTRGTRMLNTQLPTKSISSLIPRKADNNTSYNRNERKSSSIDGSSDEGSDDDDAVLVLTNDPSMPKVKYTISEQFGTVPQKSNQKEPSTSKKLPSQFAGSRWLQRLKKFNMMQAQRRKLREESLVMHRNLLESIRKVRLQQCKAEILEHWKKTPSLTLLQASQSWRLQQKVNRQKRILVRLQAIRAQLQMNSIGGLAKMTKPSQRTVFSGPLQSIPKKNSQQPKDFTNILSPIPGVKSSPVQHTMVIPPPSLSVSAPSSSEVNHLLDKPLSAKEAASKFARVDLGRRNAVSKSIDNEPVKPTNVPKAKTKQPVSKKVADAQVVISQFISARIPPWHTLRSTDEVVKRASAQVLKEWNAKDRGVQTEPSIRTWLEFEPRRVKIDKLIRQYIDLKER